MMREAKQSRNPEPTRTVGRAIVAGLLLVALGGSAPAQSSPLWHAFDGSPPGTPPTVFLDPSSTPQQTVLEITIHGFYYESVVRMSQTFLRVTLDGRPSPASYEAVGLPELPALHHVAGNLFGPSFGTPVVQVLDEITLPGALVYPLQPYISANGPLPPFQWDQAFYQQTSLPYPGTRAAALGYLGRAGQLDLVGAQTYPIRVLPASQTLIVTRHYRVTIPHPGPGTPAVLTVTRRWGHMYQTLLANNAVVNAYRPWQAVVFAGDYLILTTPSFVDEVEPLAEQKRKRGFRVTVATNDTIENTCTGLDDYIEAWHDLHPDRDHYALIVGDAEQVGTCYDGSILTERRFATIGGTDHYAEIRLGRLPCSDESECSDMVEKTLDFEDGYPGWFVGRALLVASRNDPIDGRSFETPLEEIAGESYEFTPEFQKIYGNDGPPNSDVRDAIEAGVGIATYFGHGDYTVWSDWSDDSFDIPDVELLDNNDRTPVVLALACLTHNFEQDDCLGESWLKTTNRAVASFGFTDNASDDYCREFAPDLFRRIYDEDMVILSEALESATEPLLDLWGYGFALGHITSLMSVLLGDPDLKIWREPPELPVIDDYQAFVPLGPTDITVRVRAPSLGGSSTSGATGLQPLPLAIVSLYKPGEFQINRYSDSQGMATLPIQPATPGWIYLTVYTEFDSRAVAHDSILVSGSSGVSDGRVAATLRLEPCSPNPFTRVTAVAYALPAGGAVRLGIFDVAGRRIATLVDGVQPAGRHVASWDGRDASGFPVAAGVYLVRLESGGHARNGKVLRTR